MENAQLITRKPEPIQTIGVKCPQCGYIHPPLQPGEICPMAPLETVQDDFKKIKMETDKLFSSILSILRSQIEKKKIKNLEKLFADLQINIFEFIKNYEEKK
jgi:hypothetical protein